MADTGGVRAEDLAAALRALYEYADEEMRSRWDRSLPLADVVLDRWDRARRLGFATGASIYNSALVLGEVHVGERSWIGPNVLLDGSGGPLTIGSWCSISAGVHIYTHDTVAWSLSGGEAPRTTAPVTIGSRCHLGAGSVIAPGVRIGSGCVVGAQSFVKTSVPDGAVVAGSPARVGIGLVEGTGVEVAIRTGPEAVAELELRARRSAMTVTIVDIGMGNVGSVANMVRKVGGAAVVVADPAGLQDADRVILPGVGAFDEAMTRLRQRGFADALDAVVAQGSTPVLGICLGMQLLADRSEEGALPGLGWIAGSVERLPATGPTGPVKVPHMGWSKVRAPQPHALVAGLNDDSRFYFVHSFAFCPDDPADTLLTARYGGRPFVAGVARGSVLGVQFHPEKSHRHGMALMKAFLEVGS